MRASEGWSGWSFPNRIIRLIVVTLTKTLSCRVGSFFGCCDFAISNESSGKVTIPPIIRLQSYLFTIKSLAIL